MRTPNDPLADLAVMPTLTTERLELRAISQDDAPALYEIFADAEVTRYWSRPPLVSPAEAQTLVEKGAAGWSSRSRLQWGITLRGQGRVIGTATLMSWDRDHRRAELGYALRRDRWGQGIVGEALAEVLRFGFQRMELHRIYADTDPNNAASIRVLERLGFVREGLQRHTFFHLGAWADSVMWALLEPEWARRGG